MDNEYLEELIQARVELALAKEGKHQEERLVSFNTDLASAQAKFGRPSMRGTADFNTKGRGRVNYKWALYQDVVDAVRPALNEFGFSLQQYQRTFSVSETVNQIVVVTVLSHKSGICKEFETFPLTYTPNDPKEARRVVSYLKRYGLQDSLSICADNEEQLEQPVINDKVRGLQDSLSIYADNKEQLEQPVINDNVRGIKDFEDKERSAQLEQKNIEQFHRGLAKVRELGADIDLMNSWKTIPVAEAIYQMTQWVQLKVKN